MSTDGREANAVGEVENAPAKECSMTMHIRKRTALSFVSMYEISKILTSSPNLEPTLRAVLNLMSSYMDMRRGVVAIIDESGMLKVLAASGVSPRDVSGGAARFAAGSRLPHPLR